MGSAAGLGVGVGARRASLQPASMATSAKNPARANCVRLEARARTTTGVAKVLAKGVRV
jgi:hypothetical protein